VVLGSVLTGLPRLRDLYLHGVLDGKRWDDDVKYIVALTELNQLKLCDCNARPLYKLSSAQLMPLTALRQLEV
jgi:hypothetical protein